MAKRSNFKRIERDFYATWDKRALPPLLKYIGSGVKFAEPCAGDGSLTRQLINAGNTPVWQSDIEPQANNIIQADAFNLTTELSSADYIITNPPWSRNRDGSGLMHDLIRHFKDINDTWLLFDADWMHTKQLAELIQYCEVAISVGRLKWIPNSKYDSKDNVCWYKFIKEKTTTKFIGRYK